MSAQADALLDQLEQSPVQVKGLSPIPGSSVSPTYNANVPGVIPDVDALLAEAANSNPHMSGLEDTGRSVVSGLQQGVSSIVGAAGDARDSLGGQLEHAGVPLHDLGKLASSVSLPAAIVQALGQTYPNTDVVNGLRQRVTGPDHVPQTTPGRYAQRVAQFAPMVAAGAPEGMVARGLATVGAGVGSRGGEDIAPDNLKPVASLLGGLLGGGVVGAGQAIKEAPTRLMAKALRETSPADVTKAADLQRTAAGMGVHLTPPEALAQVTNGANTMTRLQHFVENSPHGGSQVADIFAQRPAQMDAAVRGVADRVAPADTMPGATGLKAQDAAVQVLRNFDRLRSNATRPHYAAAENVHVPDEDLAVLHDSLDSAIAADKTGKISPVLSQFKADLIPNGQPLRDIGSLDTIRKIYRDKFDLPPNSPDALGKTQAATLRPFVDQLDDAMEAASPDFQNAKALHGDLSQNVVGPVNNGPLGAMANSADVGAQTRSLYPTAPPEGAANETRLASTLLPDDVAAQLARHNITDTWNGANRDLQTGENQWAGSKFAVKLAGHDEQAKALVEGLRTLPNGDAVNQGLNDLLEVGRATGKRQAPGSGTAFNEQRRAEFGMSPAPIRTAGAILDPLEWGKSVDKAVGGALYRRNIDTLADMLRASPDEAERILQAARAKGQSSMIPQLLLSAGAKDRK